jgi:hypothetical protein
MRSSRAQRATPPFPSRRMPRLLLLLSLVLMSPVAAASGERIGPYQVETIPGGVEVRVPESPGLRKNLAIAAAVCLVASVALFATIAATIPATGLAIAGIALGVAAALVAPGVERARLGREGIVVRGFAGRQGTTAIETVTGIDVRQRKPVGYETKRMEPLRRWQVTVLGVDDAPVVTFRLVQEAEATALATRISEAIGKPLRQAGSEGQ